MQRCQLFSPNLYILILWPDYVYLTTVIEVCVFAIEAVVVHPTVCPQIYDAMSDMVFSFSRLHV